MVKYSPLRIDDLAVGIHEIAAIPAKLLSFTIFHTTGICLDSPAFSVTLGNDEWLFGI